MQKMAEVRKNFNQLLRVKFFRLPKNLKRTSEVIELFEQCQLGNSELTTDFTKDCDEEELKYNIGTAMRARIIPSKNLSSTAVSTSKPVTLTQINVSDPRALL